MSIKRYVGTGLQWIAYSLGAIILAGGCLAYNIVSYDPVTKKSYDFFGRELGESFFPGPHGRDMSPGMVWNLIDMAVAVACFGIVTGLFHLGSKLRGKEVASDGMTDGTS